MASTRNKTTAGKGSPKKQGKDRVVKRPARGFHRFRSGMLNVTPKCGERKLVKANQASPLLRLPPELRLRIWEYVLGGQILKDHYICDVGPKPFRPQATERKCGLDLLSTCRQIYSETALLPYKLNTFFLGDYDVSNFGDALNYGMKMFQRRQITNIQLQVTRQNRIVGYDLARFTKYAAAARERIAALLPALKHIHVLVFNPSCRRLPDVSGCIDTTRGQLDAAFATENLKITFEVLDLDWITYSNRWDRSRPVADEDGIEEV